MLGADVSELLLRGNVVDGDAADLEHLTNVKNTQSYMIGTRAVRAVFDDVCAEWLCCRHEEVPARSLL